MKSFLLPKDTLEISEKGNARSELFNDRYHSDDGARAEAEHVFIKGNNLLTRWENSEDFTIGELGFGFGLSFLTALHFRNTAYPNPGKTLHYISIEGFPQSRETLLQYYTDSGILEDTQMSRFAETLLSQYPFQLKGIHRLYFKNPDCILTLIFHPVLEAITHISVMADCWFLDGFSPSRNPDMWSPEVFSFLHTNTKERGTFSTYSVSRSVQDHAAQAGFILERAPGFANKKEMLRGKKGSPTIPLLSSGKVEKKKNISVAIIGGGLAGASLARACAERGNEVHLFEQYATLASRASGNQAAVIMPHLSSVPDPLCRYFLMGYLHTLRVLKTIHKESPLSSLTTSGVLRLANVPKWKTIISRLSALGLNEVAQVLTPNEISTAYHITSNEDALFFPDGGSISPEELVKRLLPEHTTIHLSSKVKEVHSYDSHASLTLEDNTSIPFDYILFGSAYECISHTDTAWLPVEKIKGQLFSVHCPEQSLPPIPLCYDGYAVPLPHKNELLIGATYEHNAHEEIFSDEVIFDLTSRLESHFPEITINEEIIHKRVCFRTTSPDRLPLVGMIPRLDASPTRYYGSLGHGSRGTISTLLSAEIIASQINNETPPIEPEIIKELAPVRYLARAKKRERTLQEIYPASYEWRKS
jgi:tRNA 5-methylaminomethyl-2-thiouridine biosynthesis bifunctional protein